MKLSRIIQRYFNTDEFCYPTDFFWINKESVVEQWKKTKILSVVVLVLYFILATIAFLGYYILLPCSKNIKAKKLRVPIITEEEFVNMIS